MPPIIHAVSSWCMVDVLEAYRDFAPACNAKDAITDLLASVPQEHLAGLRSVVLTNANALAGKRKRDWSWWRGRKARHTQVAGLYHREWQGKPAWIEVFVDQILKDAPSWALRLRVVRSVVFGNVLYHEIGHHIHAAQRPEHREREDVAEEWRRRLARLHVRRRHRLAALVFRPIAWAARRVLR